MKLAIITAAAIAFAAPAMADMCSDTGELAEVVMAARQEGYPMSAWMTIIEDTEGTEFEKQIARAVVIDA